MQPLFHEGRIGLLDVEVCGGGGCGVVIVSVWVHEHVYPSPVQSRTGGVDVLVRQALLRAAAGSRLSESADKDLIGHQQVLSHRCLFRGRDSAASKQTD